MKIFKKIFIVFLLLIIYVYICNITLLPNNIIIMQGENLNINPVLGLYLNSNNNIMQASSNLNNPINTVGKLDFKLDLFNLFPVKDISVNVIPKTKVVPIGASIGMKLYTDGVLVVGMSEIEGEEPFKNSGIKEGDRILEINDKTPEWCICYNDDYDTRIYRIMKKSRKIIFPSSLKKIGSFRFRYFEAFFSSLKNVEFNEGLEEIGDFAFYRSGLEKVICPSSLKKIGQCSFYGCCNLVEVFLNDGIEKIGRTAFANNLNLHTFSVPGHKQLAQHDILCHEYYPECFVDLTDVLYSIRHPEKKDIVKNIDKSISVTIRNPSLDNLRDIIKQFSNYEYEMYYKLKNIELWNGDTKYGTYEIKSYYMTYLDVLRGLKEILKYAQREHNETEEKQK